MNTHRKVFQLWTRKAGTTASHRYKASVHEGFKAFKGVPVAAPSLYQGKRLVQNNWYKKMITGTSTGKQ
jgi:hypothetical protein